MRVSECKRESEVEVVQRSRDVLYGLAWHQRCGADQKSGPSSAISAALLRVEAALALATST